MSSSLPKIKTQINNSQTQSQKGLKFKKLKLNTSQSTDDIRQRFKSVRLSRLNSLERYSTVQQQRQYRQQKIHMNLISRKLQAGTFDQTKQIGRDLNELKQKTDFYKTQSALKLLEIEKIKNQTEQIKCEMKIALAAKDKIEEEIKKLQAKYAGQKNKNESVFLQKNCCEHMIKVRQSINLTMNNKVIMLNQYLTKLKFSTKQINNEAHEYEANMKHLIIESKKANQQLFKHQKNREDKLEEKQTIVSKKTQEEKKRELKSKQFRQSLDLVDQQLEKEQFNASYIDVLANLFIRRYSNTALQELQERYQRMENLYEQITSYQKFNASEPKQMVARYQQLPKQTVQFESKIKKLQKQQSQTQAKNVQLSSQCNKSKLIKITIAPQKNEQIKYNKKSQQLKANQKIVKIHEIMRWNEKQASNFQIKMDNNFSWQGASMNLIKILKQISKCKVQLSL